MTPYFLEVENDATVLVAICLEEGKKSVDYKHK